MKRVCIIRLQYYPVQKNVRRNAEALVKAGYKVDIIALARRGRRNTKICMG